ncbi:chorismate mutase [Rhodococcus sp. NPDC058521]|uniref:chorismate mutase n=1 Tax=Rhodococcus sp. NPDC058521 TaxID=3346536 RepID=UPI00364887BA
MYISVEEPNSNRAGTRDAARRELERLRSELDAVDSRLLDAVRERLDLCSRIGHLKSVADIAVVQPKRMEQVHERARDFALRNDLSPEFFDALYDILIAETCRLEEQIIDSPNEPQ